MLHFVHVLDSMKGEEWEEERGGSKRMLDIDRQYGTV
jgi:hypothetical protein